MLLCPLHKPGPAHIPLPCMAFATAHTQLHPSQGEVPQRLSCVHQCPRYAMQDTQRCYLQGAVIAGTSEMSSTPETITFGLSNDGHTCLFTGFLHLGVVWCILASARPGLQTAADVRAVLVPNLGHIMLCVFVRNNTTFPSMWVAKPRKWSGKPPKTRVPHASCSKALQTQRSLPPLYHTAPGTLWLPEPTT